MTQFLGLLFIILLAAEVAKSSMQARNRVHWTRFLSLETEFIGLGFYTYKLSPLNSVSMYKKRVQGTRFPSLITLIPQQHQFPRQQQSRGRISPYSSINPQPSTCPWVPIGPVFLLTVGSQLIFSSETQLFSSETQLYETIFLNSLAFTEH